jgi:hypothetical protein
VLQPTGQGIDQGQAGVDGQQDVMPCGPHQIIQGDSERRGRVVDLPHGVGRRGEMIQATADAIAQGQRGVGEVVEPHDASSACWLMA